MPIASATAGVHRNRLVLVSIAQQAELQHLVSRGQIVSADLPLWTDRRTTIILIYRRSGNFHVRKLSYDKFSC